MNAAMRFGTGLLFLVWAATANEAGAAQLVVVVLAVFGLLLVIPLTILGLMEDYRLARRTKRGDE